jgi:hypothetical protein
MLLGFYLFAIICAVMVVVSLVTNKPQKDLPTLKSVLVQDGKKPKLLWALWGVLAAIMIGLYLIF